ncbi:MAG: hypothetical protein Q8R72_07800 [Hylemonella sp.]|nr:hypothetical protein [Hylemonella sp.]
MHSAPAVSYPVGRSNVRRVGILLPWLLGALTCIAWALQSERLTSVHGLAVLFALSGAVLAHAELRRPEEGLLAWDGQSWSWEAQGRRHDGKVRARLDWQHGLLLEFLPLDGRGFWLWPERQMAPLMWISLRRAVYAPVAATRNPSEPRAHPESGS